MAKIHMTWNKDRIIKSKFYFCIVALMFTEHTEQ